MKWTKSIPYSYHWLVKKVIGDDIKTILDLGCGEGNFMKDIKSDNNWEITGVELYKPSVIKAKKTGVYKNVYQNDVISFLKSTKNKYDLVFCSQVLEHLTEKDGLKLIQLVEKIAKKRIVICTPVGFIEFDRVEVSVEDDNPLETHLSGWNPQYFIKNGYQIFGQGLNVIYGKSGLIRRLPRIFWPFLILMSYLFSPLVAYNHKLATYFIAYKNK